MAKLYVGRLSDRTREKDLEDAFGRYGKIARIEMKFGFGFVEFEDKLDADDALKALNGSDLQGNRIVVEMSYVTQGVAPKRRERPGEGRCFSCGEDGHWARDCPRPSRGRDSRDRPRRGGRSRSRSPRRSPASPRYSPYRGRNGSGSPDRRDRERDRDSPRRERERDRSPRRRSRSRSPRDNRRRSRSPRKTSPSSKRPRSRSPVARDRDRSRDRSRSRERDRK